MYFILLQKKLQLRHWYTSKFKPKAIDFINALTYENLRLEMDKIKARFWPEKVQLADSRYLPSMKKFPENAQIKSKKKKKSKKGVKIKNEKSMKKQGEDAQQGYRTPRFPELEDQDVHHERHQQQKQNILEN